MKPVTFDVGERNSGRVADVEDEDDKEVGISKIKVYNPALYHAVHKSFVAYGVSHTYPSSLTLDMCGSRV